MLCWVVGQLGGSHMFTSQNKHFFIWHFHSTGHWYCLLICDSIWLPWQFSIFCLDNVFIFLYIIIVYSCPIWYFLYVFLSTALWIVFAPCSPCMSWLSLLLLWVFLLEYDCGLFLVWSRMASSGSVCLFCVFRLVSYVIFCCYGCWLDVMYVTCNYSPCHCNLYVIWLVVMIVSPLLTIVPWVCSPLSSCWTTTVDPMGIDTKTRDASLFVLCLLCLCINFIWCSSSLSTLTCFLSITGITLYTRWLNSNIAGLCRSCPSGIVQICNNAMWMSSLESEHFL